MGCIAIAFLRCRLRSQNRLATSTCASHREAKFVQLRWAQYVFKDVRADCAELGQPALGVVLALLRREMTPAHAVCRCCPQELVSVLFLMSAVLELLRCLDAACSGKWPTQRLSNTSDCASDEALAFGMRERRAPVEDTEFLDLRRPRHNALQPRPPLHHQPIMHRALVELLCRLSSPVAPRNASFANASSASKAHCSTTSTASQGRL